MIEAALVHVDKNAIRSAYNRSDYLEKRKKMMQWCSGHIEAAAEGALSLSGLKKFRIVS